MNFLRVLKGRRVYPSLVEHLKTASMPEFIFGRLIFTYGEKPRWVAATAGGLIGTWGWLFWYFGLAKNIGAQGELTGSAGFLGSMYLSVVTFTTLGLGDMRPVCRAGKVLVGIEA